MIVLFVIIDFFLVALIAACFSYTLNFYMQPGMILNFWRVFLNKYLRKYIGSFVSVLGNCMYCTNFWLSLSLWFLVAYFDLGLTKYSSFASILAGILWCTSVSNILLLYIANFFDDYV